MVELMELSEKEDQRMNRMDEDLLVNVENHISLNLLSQIIKKQNMIKTIQALNEEEDDQEKTYLNY